MKKQITAIASFLGCALLFVGQTLHGQQNETDTKQLADIRAKAQKGEAKAQFKLGMTLFAGDLGATPNDIEAVKWIRKAADQNDVEAQNLLGDCYISARGVAANSAELQMVSQGSGTGEMPSHNLIWLIYMRMVTV